MEEFFQNYYFLIIMLSAATIVCFLWLFIFNRERLHAKWWELIIVCLLHTFIGVGFVKLFAILESGGDFSNNGMSLYGGLFFMPLVYLIYAKAKKLPVFEIFDIFAVCLAITYFFARFNCIHSGCCLGKIYDNVHGARYPTREIEIVFFAVSAIGGGLLNVRGYLKEKVFLVFLGSYGVLRFILEFMRESSSAGIFHIAHLWSSLSIIVVVTTLIIKAYLKKEKSNR